MRFFGFDFVKTILTGVAAENPIAFFSQRVGDDVLYVDLVFNDNDGLAYGFVHDRVCVFDF